MKKDNKYHWKYEINLYKNSIKIYFQILRKESEYEKN